MRASTKRMLSILLSGIFLIGAVVVFASWAKPEFDKAREKRATLVSKEALLRDQEEAVRGVQEMLGEFQDVINFQELANLSMPTEENTTQILGQLDAMSRRSQASISTFDSSPLPFEGGTEPIVKRLGRLQINMSVEGEYEGIKNFIGLLETNVRIFDVEQLDIVSVPLPGQDEPLIDLSLRVNTYFQE